MKTYFYIAVTACALGFAAFGLSFSPLGVYALISSILLGITSLAFVVRQKKKENLKALIYVKIAAYFLLALAVALFIGGLVYSAQQV